MRAFAAMPTRPKRTILMLAVTGEEQGLLGSGYYAANPLYPLAKTLGVVNMDALNVLGKTKDLTVTGLGNSDLDDYAQKVAAEQGREIRPDPTPEKGGFYRSDHFPFAQQGVPALASGGGIDDIRITTRYFDHSLDAGINQRLIDGPPHVLLLVLARLPMGI